MLGRLIALVLLAASAVSAFDTDTISVPFRTLNAVKYRGKRGGHGGGNYEGGVSASGSSSRDNQGNHYSSTSDPVKYKRHSTQKSSITCTAHASSKGYSKAKDAHLYAVTTAIKYGCSHKIDKDWRKEVEKKFLDDSAYAVAEVWAKADATCKGEGNVYGCAAAYAVAKRWAKAWGSAYADAYADAYNSCKCNKKRQEAGAYAFGTAEEMVDLVAKVSAVAEADVCIYGTGYESSHVESHCLQKVYANLWAKSISKALIEGDCYKGLDADAYIKAEAVIDTWEYVDCASHAKDYY